MPESERNAFITNIINGITRAETEGRTTVIPTGNIWVGIMRTRDVSGNIEQEGKWYFYNQSALTFGRTEFRRR